MAGSRGEPGGAPDHGLDTRGMAFHDVGADGRSRAMTAGVLAWSGGHGPTAPRTTWTREWRDDECGGSASFRAPRAFWAEAAPMGG